MSKHLLYFLIINLLIALLLSRHTYIRYNDFKNHHIALVNESVNSLALEISGFIKERQRLVALFAQENKELMSRKPYTAIYLKTDKVDDEFSLPAFMAGGEALDPNAYSRAVQQSLLQFELEAFKEELKNDKTLTSKARQERYSAFRTKKEEEYGVISYGSLGDAVVRPGAGIRPAECAVRFPDGDQRIHQAPDSSSCMKVLSTPTCLNPQDS